MRFSQSRLARVVLLAAAVALGSVVIAPAAHAQVTQPQAPQGIGASGVCKDIDLHVYFICATTDFICIGGSGSGDCNLRLNRLGRNDFGVVVDFRFIATAGGLAPEVRDGQFVFEVGQSSSLVRYRLAVPVRSAEVHLLYGETVIHRERVTIGTGPSAAHAGAVVSASASEVALAFR